ncbi:MAG: hypothetical protein WAL13_05470, partial [Trebonia sp.]
PKAEPGARAGPAAARSGAALSTPGMGDRLGWKSLVEEMVLTPSRRQLRRREEGWEASPRRIPAPGNTNRLEGEVIRVSPLKKAKPVTVHRVVT